MRSTYGPMDCQIETAAQQRAQSVRAQQRDQVTSVSRGLTPARNPWTRRRQLSVSDGVARVSWHDDLQSVEELNRTTLAPLPTSFGTKILVFKTNGYGPSIGMRCIWSLSANSHLGS